MAGDSFNFKAPDYYNFENSDEDGEDADDFFSSYDEDAEKQAKLQTPSSQDSKPDPAPKLDMDDKSPEYQATIKTLNNPYGINWTLEDEPELTPQSRKRFFFVYFLLLILLTLVIILNLIFITEVVRNGTD